MIGKVYKTINISSPKGPIQCRYYKAPGATSAVITVGGCGGGYHNPVSGHLYPDLLSSLHKTGVSGLHLTYRDPGNLKESSYDLVQGIEFLKQEGVTKAGIVGWSFGGAVVCQGAAADTKSASGIVKAIVTLATQSAGVAPISDAKGVASLFIHGTTDTCLPVRCSEHTYKIANEPKKLKIVEDHHGFFDVGDEVERDIKSWFGAHGVC